MAGALLLVFFASLCYTLHVDAGSGIFHHFPSEACDSCTMN